MPSALHIKAASEHTEPLLPLPKLADVLNEHPHTADKALFEDWYEHGGGYFNRQYGQALAWWCNNSREHNDLVFAHCPDLLAAKRKEAAEGLTCPEHQNWSKAQLIEKRFSERNTDFEQKERHAFFANHEIMSSLSEDAPYRIEGLKTDSGRDTALRIAIHLQLESANAAAKAATTAITRPFSYSRTSEYKQLVDWARELSANANAQLVRLTYRDDCLRATDILRKRAQTRKLT